MQLRQLVLEFPTVLETSLEKLDAADELSEVSSSQLSHEQNTSVNGVILGGLYNNISLRWFMGDYMGLRTKPCGHSMP